MRFLLCLVIWVVFIGGLYLYTSQRQGPVPQAAVAAPSAPQIEQSITIELTPTFSVEDDPFALKTEEKQEPIEIRLNGEPIQAQTAEIGRGKTLRISEARGVRSDHNELFVKASPPLSESSLDHGIRVRLLSGDRVLAEKTIWSSGGGLVSGSVSFTFSDTVEKSHGE